MSADNVRRLVDRARRRADQEAAKPRPEKSEMPTAFMRDRLEVIDGDNLGDTASDGRHAGADLDELEAADIALFDPDSYGYRSCESCGTRLDARRRDARTCSSSCRGRRWRADQ